MSYLDDMKWKKMKDLNENIYPSSGGSATYVVYTTKSGGVRDKNDGDTNVMGRKL